MITIVLQTVRQKMVDYQRDMEEAFKNRQTQGKRVMAMEQQLDQCRGIINEKETLIRELIQNLQKLRPMKEELHSLLAINKEMSVAIKDKDTNISLLSKRVKEMEGLANQGADATEALMATRQSLSIVQTELREAKDLVAQQQLKNSAQVKEIEGLRALCTGLQKQIEVKEYEESSLREAVTEMAYQLNKVEHENHTLKNTQTSRISNDSDEGDKLSVIQQMHEAMMNSMREEKKELQGQIESLTAKLISREVEIATLKRENQWLSKGRKDNNKDQENICIDPNRRLFSPHKVSMQGEDEQLESDKSREVMSISQKANKDDINGKDCTALKDQSSAASAYGFHSCTKSRLTHMKCLHGNPTAIPCSLSKKVNNIDCHIKSTQPSGKIKTERIRNII